MALNTLEYATQLQTALDEKAVAQLTSGWMDGNASQVIYHGGNKVRMPEMEVTGLKDYDRDNGYPSGSVTLAFKDYEMTQDRGTSFQLDAMDVDESNFVATASSVMGEFQRVHVVPEIDAYRYSSIASQAMTANQAQYGYTAAESTILGALLDDIAAVQDVVGDGTPLVISMSVKVAAIFDRSEKLAKSLSVTDFKQGDVTMKVKSIDGQHPIIRVGSARMKTSYVFNDGKTSDQEGGGFEPGSDAKDINWIICPRTTPIAVSRTDKMRIFDPDTYQKANAWAMDYRKYHDLWLPTNKLPTVMVNIKQAKA